MASTFLSVFKRSIQARNASHCQIEHPCMARPDNVTMDIGMGVLMMVTLVPISLLYPEGRKIAFLVHRLPHEDLKEKTASLKARVPGCVWHRKEKTRTYTVTK